MKCVGCGIETGFEWPGGETPQTRALWEAVYEGPLCKVCSGESPMRALVDGQEPSEQFCYALRRRQTSALGILEFEKLLRQYGRTNTESPNVDNVEDL
jgi:hypothetical protein